MIENHDVDKQDNIPGWVIPTIIATVCFVLVIIWWNATPADVAAFFEILGNLD